MYRTSEDSMREISTLVTNYDPPESGFSLGKFRNNPGDDTGSKATAAIVNDLYYAVEAIAYKWIGALSNTEESEALSDILTAIEKLAAIIGPEDHVESYDYPDKSVIFYNDIQYRATKDINYLVDGATFPLQYSNGAWLRVDEDVHGAIESNTQAIYNILNPQDISGNDVHVTTRRGPYRGVGVTHEPIRKFFYGNDYVPDMPYAQRSGAAAELYGKLYVAGGGNAAGTVTYDYLYEYDPINKIWTPKASLNETRKSFALVAANGKLYAIGGYSTGIGDLISVEEYDPNENTWVYKTPLTYARRNFVACYTNNKILVFGGVAAGVTLDSVESFDTVLNVWTEKTSMPTARYELSLIQGSSHVYLIGGYGTSGSTSVNEEYDPVNDTWDTKTAMPTAKLLCMYFTINNKGFLIGGYDGVSTTQRDVEIYDINSNTWDTDFQIPFNAGYGAFTVFRNEVFYFGGYDPVDGELASSHKLIYVYDWLYNYIKTNTNELQIIAKDSFNSWKGQIEKRAFNTETTPIWLDWDYSDKVGVQWFKMPLFNGWSATNSDGGLFLTLDKNGYGMLVGAFLTSASASSKVITLLPDFIKIGLYQQSVTAVDSNGDTQYASRAFIDKASNEVRLNNYTRGQSANFTLIFKNEI